MSATTVIGETTSDLNATSTQTLSARILELENALELTEAIIESSPVGQVMIDESGAIVVVNRVALEMFGWDRSELMGKQLEVLLPNRFGSQHSVLRSSFFDRPTSRTMGVGRELFGVRKDGSEFPVDVGLTPLELGGKVYALSGIADITLSKQAEANLKTANEKLLQSNAELEQFAYIASHDLQEPLRKIASYAQLLQEDYHESLDDVGRNYLDIVINGADRLKRLTTDLLTYSRINTQGRKIQTTSSADALECAIGNLELVIDETNTQISFGEMLDVLADESQLVMLFQNLLGNAIKFRGQRTPQIHVDCSQRDDMAVFRITDNGIGIEKEYFERIFRIFQRLHNRREYEGTGIGLALCQRIVTRFGGCIRVESTPGEGSTFEFEIPFAIPRKECV